MAEGHNKIIRAALLVIGGIFVWLIVYHWIARPVEKGREQTIHAREHHSGGVFPPEEGPYGIPEIDPLNDPLAPIARKTESLNTPRKTRPVQGESDPEATYELPLEVTILPQ